MDTKTKILLHKFAKDSFKEYFLKKFAAVELAKEVKKIIASRKSGK